MTESNKKKTLPVALSKDQHDYLKSKGKKAEYLRNLLIVDMANNKDDNDE